MPDIKKIADEADLIVNGYAYTKAAIGYRVLNLKNPERAVVFSRDGEVLETSMDDIEISIARGYLQKNKELMEE